MRLRRMALAIGAGVMMLTTAGVAGSVAPAQAMLPTGTGLVNCGLWWGKMHFLPAWSDTGTGTVTMRLSTQATNCSGGSPTPTVVHITWTFQFPNGGGSCSSGRFATFDTPLIKVRYFRAVKNSKVWPGVFKVTGTMFDIENGTIDGSYFRTNIHGSGFYASLSGTPKRGDCSSGLRQTSLSSGGFSGL